MNTILTNHPILEIFQKEEEMEKDALSGAMEKFMMANGKMVERTEVEYGKAMVMFHMLENGEMIRLKALEF